MYGKLISRDMPDNIFLITKKLRKEFQYKWFVLVLTYHLLG